MSEGTRLRIIMKQAEVEMNELELIYGQNFPEPSAQLDRFNEASDRYWNARNEYEKLFRDTKLLKKRK